MDDFFVAFRTTAMDAAINYQLPIDKRNEEKLSEIFKGGNLVTVSQDIDGYDNKSPCLFICCKTRGFFSLALITLPSGDVIQVWFSNIQKWSISND